MTTKRTYLVLPTSTYFYPFSTLFLPNKSVGNRYKLGINKVGNRYKLGRETRYKLGINKVEQGTNKVLQRVGCWVFDASLEIGMLIWGEACYRSVVLEEFLA